MAHRQQLLASVVLLVFLIADTTALRADDASVLSWSGNGSKATEQFQMLGPWRIRWAASAQTAKGEPSLAILVRGEEGKVIASALVGGRAQSGQVTIRETGLFYLKIDGLHCDWNVAVGSTTDSTPDELQASADAPKVSSSADQNTRTLRSPAKLIVGSEVLLVHFGNRLIYAIKDRQGKYAAHGVSSLLLEDNGRLAIGNRYLKISDKTECAQFSSSNSQILAVDSKGNLTIRSPGSANVTIKIDGSSVDIPFDVVAIPVVAGMDKDAVIAKMGMPDDRTKRHISWLESANVDGILYYAGSDDVYGVSIDHWQYKTYPGAILRFDILERLQNCAQPGWEGMEMKRYELEHGSPASSDR